MDFVFRYSNLRVMTTNVIKIEELYHEAVIEINVKGPKPLK